MDPKYTADITLTQNDIKRLGKMLQGDQKKGYIFTAIALVWILYAAFFQLRNGRPMLGIFMIVVVIGCVIITLFTSGRQVRKNYEMIKAAGGVRSREDFEKMIELGANRIGTSSGTTLITKGE